MNIQIFGAGLAGLLAGCIFPKAQLFDAKEEKEVNHKALLRFRTPAVGQALGIDFEKVTVHKGIWINGQFVEPTIQLANWYSKKVINRFEDRSIWNLAPVERFIAPENLIEQMIDRCAGRVHWECPVSGDDIFGEGQSAAPVISTMPLPRLIELYCEADAAKNEDSLPYLETDFQFASIHVCRLRVKDANVFQTIYYPTQDASFKVYRASITRDLLIIESMEDIQIGDIAHVCASFGIAPSQIDFGKDNSEQKFGKIAPINEELRKKLLFFFSQQHNIYSLGRFATWRNILLDDVLHDVSVVKRLMNSGIYNRSLVQS